ncbi:MAG: filamentation induced by cAMP protein Fic [Actinotalea sp.]|nr:filamentation induced by cAMP protein Fic [Actinotalea sp.]
MPGHPLESLAALPGVGDAVGEARAGCEELRWHRALRRTWPAARAEAGFRCAHAGTVLDGLRVPLALVRDVARDALPPPAGPDGDAVLGALRVQSVVEGLMAPPSASAGHRSVPFAQLLVRLHVAAHVRGSVGAPGRPRGTDQPADLVGLGPAVTGAELAARLTALGDLVSRPLPAHVPALVLAAVVHGELLTLRPFSSANAAVARAVFRLQLTWHGVDPVGVVVPEAQWAQTPMVYLSSAAGFATGEGDRVAAWLRGCAAAVARGAQEGTAVADAVLAGRLEPRPPRPGDPGDGPPHDDGAPRGTPSSQHG